MPGQKRKKNGNVGRGGVAPGQGIQPVVVEARQQNVAVAAQPEALSVANPVAKKIKVYCWKCKVKTHATKDCTIEHYCYIFDNSKHPMSKCPTLKLPKPTTFVAGFGDEELMFNQFPDSVYKEQLTPSIPTTCVKVVGEVVTAMTVERQVVHIC